MSEKHVGVDVSKDRLDVAITDGRWLQFTNDDSGHEELCALLVEEKPLVVMEATGGLERALATRLSAAAIPVRIVNARRQALRQGQWIIGEDRSHRCTSTDAFCP